MYIKNVIKLFKNLLMRFYAKDYYTTKNFHQTKMLYLCFLNFYCLMNFLYKSEVEHRKVTIEKISGVHEAHPKILHPPFDC